MARVIPLDEHVFIAGKTGSGKTYFAKKYLTNYESVFCLDTKGTLVWNEVKPDDIQVITRVRELASVTKQKVIYRPVFEELEHDYYNAFFRYCYERRNCIVWIDEVMSIATHSRIPDYYKGILTRGRELNVTAWSLTQRPAGIPILVMSESNHFIVFDLNMPQDRERLVSITGQREFLEKPSKFGRFAFWYFDVNHEKAIPARLKEREVIA